MERKSSADKKRILARNEERSLIKKKKGENNLPSQSTLPVEVTDIDTDDDPPPSNDDWPSNPDVRWTQEDDEMVVMRPPLGRRSVPILHNRKQKEERTKVISRQIRALEESKEKLRQLKKERVGVTESGRTDKLRIIEDI